jgi:hypothetical protein
MPNYSARDMLLRMANGGSVGVATSALNNIVPTYGKNNATAADLLAAEQRILGEIAADPSSWDPAVAYNAILESGVTIEDALAAGVKQSTIDAIFTSGAPLPVTAFSTPSTVTSAYESAPYAGQDMQPFYNQAQNYVSGLMADGVITPEERREAQTLATQGGYTFQDILAAGVDPSILFNVTKTPEEIAKEKQLQDSVDRFVNTQPEYVAPTVYQPIDFDPGIYAPGQEALDREFRDSPPRTEVLDQYGNLAGFDYTPAAKLLSATGSGFSFTPPSVTSRPRSLMDTGTLNRYTQGRAAQDLRQLVGNQTIDGITPEQRYESYAGLLGNTGSYGGGLSRSQLFALKRQQDSQRKAAPEAGSTTGTIADYLAKYEDVRTDYARAKAAGEIPANQTPEAFARNHYNKYGRFDRPFTLVEDTGDTGGGQSYTSPAIAGFGEGDEESRQSNFITRGYDTELLARDLGTAGGARIVPVFAEGGPVKKPRGFEDGGPADSMTADELTAQLMAMDSAAPVEEPRPTDQVQTESRSILDNLNRAMSQVTQPVVAAVTDMTVGLGDLAQMGTKAVANKMGIETKPFVPVGENIKASLGADNVSPLNPIYMGTQILPAAKLQKALAAGPAAYRELMAYLAGEGGAQVAATQFPDSLAAQLAGAVTGDMSARGILDSLDGRNVRRMAGDEPPIDDGPLLEGEPEGTVLGISDQSESGKMLETLTPEKISATAIDLNNPLTPKVQKIAADRTAREQDLALLEGDIKKKRVTVKIDDLARAIDQDHVETYGRKLDPTSPEDQDLAAKVIASNIDEQMTKETTGAGWYDADVEKTFTTLSKIPGLEELQNNESLRVLWSALAAPTSIGLKVNQNAKAATAALLEYVRTGKVPTNPPAPGAVTQGISGAGWGPKGKSVAAGMKVISTLVDKYGVDGFADWWLSPHTLKELTDVRKEAGLKSAPSGLSGGRDSMHLGSMILGDKTGRFSLNINGYEGTTKDVWYTRSYNRAFGQMFGNADEVQGGPRNQTERREMEAFNQKVLDNIATGQLSEADAQAILWFYEQGLYSRLGVPSRPGAFSEGVEEIYGNLGVRQPIRGSDEVKIEAESPTGLENYRGLSGNLRAVRANRRLNAGLDNGSSFGGATGPYSTGVVGTDGGTGLLTFTPDPAVLRRYEAAGNSLPAIKQVSSAPNAASYNADMTRAMAGNPAGAQVEIKSAEDLSGYNLFRTEAGSGFAIKPDGDIVAVFASPNEPPRGSYAMLQAAVQAGGTKLDAFDTFLPKIYENVGFRPVARLPWNDEFAPPNWDKKVFAKHNNGEPDIVFFVHDPEYFGGAKDVPVVTDYDDAVRLQDEALGAVTPAAKGPEARTEEITALNKSGEPLGINIAVDKNGTDYADLIVSGTKKFESRETASLKPYVGKRVGIVRTGAGPAEVIGSVEIGRPIEVNEKQFNQLRDQHLVAEDSSFNIKKGQTKFLYPMMNPISTPAQKVTSKGIVARALPARNAGDEPKLEQGNQVVTEQQRKDWREANKGDFKQEQTPELAEAAEKLGRGEISISDYSKEVDRLRPITPLTDVPRIASFEDIASALDANKVAKGIIGLDTEIADGTMVGSRLDIPAYNNYNTWVVSVHEGAGTSGSSLGYGKVAVLDDVKFNSNAKAAFGVATGEKAKAPFARMNGKWRNVDPEVAREQAEKFINDPNWTQVGMNPYRHSFFYDKATGQPVDSAKEVIQIGPLVLAKGVKTRPLESPEHALDPKKRKKGEPEYFKHGGSVERVYNDNRTYK